jgi:FAD:protein FMN transferase
MKKRLVLSIFYLFIVFSITAQNRKYTFQRPKMGSPFIIVAYATDSLKLSAAVEKAYQRVDILNAIFSDYLETSEISLLAKAPAKTWQKVSLDLLNMLKISQKAAQMSDNAFDITVGNIVKIWRKARKEKQLPPKKDIEIALSKTGFRHIELDTLNAQIRINTEGVRLDFGGIVKGYAAQEAVRILKEDGFQYALVDAGGDLAMSEKTQNTEGGWQIAVSVPNSENQLLPRFLSLKNQAVATSGDMYNFLEINGKRYSHIVNPKTGVGLTHQRNVTIIAPDGALADWLATACSVLSVKKALKLVKRFPNTDILILENKKGQIKKWESAGFSQYFSSN